MESKLAPNLFFAGEVLNVDGVTGGFNFQNAWTTGWIAAKAIAGKYLNLKICIPAPSGMSMHPIFFFGIACSNDELQ